MDKYPQYFRKLQNAMITRRVARPSGIFSSNAWTCPACTRAHRLLPPSTLSRLLPTQHRRSVHQVQPMAYDETFSSIGVKGLLSNVGYDFAWTQYQDFVIQKLNELTAGTDYENGLAKSLVLKYARDPTTASVFNYASMAFNNQFFFKTLSPAPVGTLGRQPKLQQSLEQAFGSMDTLRTTMLDSAAAMFGPGFTWLVWARNVDGPSTGSRKGSWRILNTYSAGTPFPEAGYRQQGLDMNTSDRSTYDAYVQQTAPAYPVGSFGAASLGSREQAKIPPGGTNLMPVLCVSTWEHTYIRDYGVAGKLTYLGNWWDAVDWAEVDANAPGEALSMPSFHS